MSYLSDCHGRFGYTLAEAELDSVKKGKYIKPCRYCSYFHLVNQVVEEKDLDKKEEVKKFYR